MLVFKVVLHQTHIENDFWFINKNSNLVEMFFVCLNTFLTCSLVKILEMIVKVKLLLKKPKKMTFDKKWNLVRRLINKYVDVGKKCWGI